MKGATEERNIIRLGGLFVLIVAGEIWPSRLQ